MRKKRRQRHKNRQRFYSVKRHAGKIDGASELIELAKAGLTLDDIAVTQGFGTVLARSEELWEDSLCCGLISGPM